jgi:glycosyltransferase involved in cell wall biosynthesis
MLQQLFNSGKYEEVINYFSENKPVTQNDFSLLALSYYNLNKKNKAIGVLKEMLKKYPNNPDALFNLTIIYYQLKNWNKVKEFGESYFNLDSSSWEINDILSDLYVFEGNFEKALKHMELALKNVPNGLLNDLKIKFQLLKEKIQTSVKKPKLAFICAAGLDNFINDIIEGLSDEYWVRKYTVKSDREIYEAIDWADIVWLEWANEVAIIGTNYPGIVGKKVIVRLHRYEAFSNFIEKIKWDVVDKLILVAGSMKEVLEIYHKEKYNEFKDKIEIVYNGIKIDNFEFKEREPGFNIALAAHLHTRKNIMLALQIMDALVKIDKKFKLHIAGDFQDPVLELYLKYMVKEMGLEDNVIFYGWVDDMDEWWEDKNYLLSTSIHEGHPYNIMEAMARGIKPVIHNFYGAKELYDYSLIFSTIDEAVKKIVNSDYYSLEYRMYVIRNGWVIGNTIRSIKDIIKNICCKKDLEPLIKKEYETMKGEVAIISLSELSPRRGGPSAYLWNLKEGFKQINFDDCIFISNKHLLPFPDFKNENELISAFNIWFENNIVELYKRHKREIDNAKILHFHSPIELYYFYKLFAKSKIMREKYFVLSFHMPELPSQEVPGWFGLSKDSVPTFSKIIDDIFIESIKIANHIVLPNRYVLECYNGINLDKLMEQKKISYIPTGVPVVMKAPQDRRKFNIVEDEIIIGYLGRRNHIKGFDIFLQIIDRLNEEKIKFKALVAGRGERLIKSNVLDLGIINDINSFFGLIDILIVPNRQTFFDLVILEAISSGTPVITTRIGGNKYFQEHEIPVILCDPVNVVEEMVKVIKDLGNNKSKINDLAKKLQKAYKEMFSLKKFAEEYSNLYKDLLKNL